jgi:hypothetical protein
MTPRGVGPDKEGWVESTSTHHDQGDVAELIVDERGKCLTITDEQDTDVEQDLQACEDGISK